MNRGTCFADLGAYDKILILLACAHAAAYR
jgi:hypothetical protein